MNKKIALSGFLVVATTLILAGCTIGGTGMVDCGTDLECFSENAQNCTPAKVTLDVAELLGATGIGDTGGMELEYYYEIQGGTVEACTFYMKINKFRMPDMDGSMATMIEGKDMTCIWPVSGFTAGGMSPFESESMLETCQGSLIDMIGQTTPTSYTPT